jgi:hypothetical protein
MQQTVKEMEAADKAGYDRALSDVIKGVDIRRGWDRDDGFIYRSNLIEVIEKLRADKK